MAYMWSKRESWKDHFVSGVPMVGGQTPRDFDEYLAIMETPGTYIEGDLEIQAACEALNVNIDIRGIDGAHDRLFRVVAPNLETRTVGLVHYDAPGQSAHYWYVMLPRHRHLEPRQSPHDTATRPSPTPPQRAPESIAQSAFWESSLCIRSVTWQPLRSHTTPLKDHVRTVPA